MELRESIGAYTAYTIYNMPGVVKDADRFSLGYHDRENKRLYLDTDLISRLEGIDTANRQRYLFTRLASLSEFLLSSAASTSSRI